MINAYDIAYALAGLVTAPAWVWSRKARTKASRLFAPVPQRPGTNPAILIHAVSVGELNATRALVAQLLAARPDLHVVITTTTETGLARSQQLYGNDPRITLTHYPLDLSPAISRLLDNLRPAVAVLMELEVWPNFALHCRRRGIPMLVVNGRLTPHSAKRYALLSPVTRRMFSRLTAVAAQDQTYADSFVSLGTPRDRVTVTGTMKFDTVDLADTVPDADELARDLNLRPDEPLLVCGSTGPGEERLMLDAYRALLKDFPPLRLAIVPRHPERFDEVAGLISDAGFPVLRRSSPRATSHALRASVILGDTMGELRKFYALAAVVLVGRTLLDLGPRQRGSDMIEPAALAKPTVVGPWTHNFAEVVNAFRACKALYEIDDPSRLAPTLGAILSDPAAARSTAVRARTVVRDHQGATARHVDLILRHIPHPS